MKQNRDPLQELAVQLREFAREREWDQFHSPKNLSMALIAEAAELVEHFQWLTEEQSDQLRAPELLGENRDPEDGSSPFELSKHNLIREELADIFLYLIRIADKLNVDLLKAAKDKIEINAEKYPVAKVKGKSKKYTEY